MKIEMNFYICLDYVDLSDGIVEASLWDLY